MKASYKGEASVKNFTSLDKANAEEFLKWNSLYFGVMDATYNPALRQYSPGGAD